MPKLAIATRPFLALAALTLQLMTSPALAATVFTVDTLADDPAKSTCDPAIPIDCSLRGAVIAAHGLPPAEQVTILVPDDHFFLDEDGPGEDAGLTGDLDVHRNLTIRPIGDFSPMILGSDLDDGLFEVHAGQLTIHGLIVSDSIPPADTHAIRVQPGASLHLDSVTLQYNGTGSHGGGLRVNQNASATLERCEIHHNQAEEGAGIFVLGGSLSVSSSRFYRNTVYSDGGGILIRSGFDDAFVTVRHTLFEDNEAFGSGAGIASDADSTLLVADSFFLDNSSQGPGGAIYSEGLTTVRRSSFFADASAAAGSAIHVEDDGSGKAYLDISNSTVSDVEQIDSTAISLSGADAVVSHVTMSQNDGFDIELRDGSHLSLRGSILTRGCDAVASTMDSGGYNLVGAFRPLCWDIAAGGDGEIAIFELGDLAPAAYSSWDYLDTSLRTPGYEPLETSPAVAAVASGGCPDSEQRGNARPHVGCDIGSVERDPLPSELLFDGFESGDESSWSISVP